MRTPIPDVSSLRRKSSVTRRPNVPTFRRRVDVIKECLGIAKDCFDIGLKFWSLVLVLPAITLWIYLHKIGWSEIFIDSLGSVPGLVTLLACSSLLFVLLILQFFMPALLMALSVEAIRKRQVREPKSRWWSTICILCRPSSGCLFSRC